MLNRSGWTLLGLLVTTTALLAPLPAGASGPSYDRVPLVLGGEILLHPFDDRDRDLPYPHFTQNRGVSHLDGMLMHNFPVEGLHGQAYTMEGDDMSFIDLRWGMTFAADQDFTLFACFRSEEATGRGTILGQLDWPHRDELLTLDIAPGGSLEFRVMSPDRPLQVVASPQRVDDGAWHCAAGLKEGGDFALWLDGAMVAREAASDFVGVDFQTMTYVGCKANGIHGMDCMRGAVDEVRIYPRALAPEELARLAADPSTDAVLALQVDADGSAPQASVRPEALQAPATLEDGTLRVEAGIPVWVETAGFAHGKALPGATVPLPTA